MAENSKIEWCDHTVNLWWGCAKVHTGCKNCYAEALSNRFGDCVWGEDKGRKRIKSAFNDLNKYQEKAAQLGIKYKIFIGSMMDIFESYQHLLNPMVGARLSTDDLRDELFKRMTYGLYNNLIFLFLTKRPENIVHYIPYNWVNNIPENVWFGTSVSNMETLEYLESLKLVSNTNLFLSIEPQIEMIDKIDLTGVKWVIQGGESGSKKRPFNIDWAYKMKEICQFYGVPYFFKQIDKVQPIPKDLLIKEIPKF